VLPYFQRQTQGDRIDGPEPQALAGGSLGSLGVLNLQFSDSAQSPAPVKASQNLSRLPADSDRGHVISRAQLPQRFHGVVRVFNSLYC
jgi:hypothetical protein